MPAAALSKCGAQQTDCEQCTLSLYPQRASPSELEALERELQAERGHSERVRGLDPLARIPKTGIWATVTELQVEYK
jgi:hypothetical protein